MLIFVETKRNLQGKNPHAKRKSCNIDLIENIPIKCFPQIRLCFDGIHREPSLFFLLIAFAHDKVLDSLLILFTFEKVTLSRPLAEKQPYTQQYGPIFLLACSLVPSAIASASCSLSRTSLLSSVSCGGTALESSSVN